MAIVNPAAVVIRASEMPPASCAGSPTPTTVIAVNTRIMPMTVPSRPSSGVIVDMVPSVFMKRSISCTT